MDPPQLFSTIIDIDGQNPLGNSDALPTWLRDVLQRALTAGGFSGANPIKSASDEAISSLVKLDYSIVCDTECPICFERYQQEIIQDETVDNNRQNYVHDLHTYNALINNDAGLVDKLSKISVVIESKQQSSKFDDPGLFFPTTVAGSNYSRFPQRNLSTFKKLTLAEQFPGYKDKEQAEKEKEKRIKEFKRDGHIAVKMPECGHIFGLSCIVEWLKSNVSCPLCRKEVEAKIEDPHADRLATIKSTTLHNFNNEETVVDHISNHSTDVFSPYRRPYNPAITPVTDSYLPQNWVTPYTQTKVNVPDPELVLPRKFPFFEPQVHAIPLRRTTIRNPGNQQQQQQQERTPQANDRTQRSPSNERRVNFSPHTININDLHDSSDSSPEQPQQDDQEQARNPFSFIQRLQSRLRPPSGGPDRSRNIRERRHPYSRPSEQEDSN